MKNLHHLFLLPPSCWSGGDCGRSSCSVGSSLSLSLYLSLSLSLSLSLLPSLPLPPTSLPHPSLSSYFYPSYSPLPTSLPPSLPPSFPPSSSDPPSSVSASHYICLIFLILSHSSLLVYTPLHPRFRPPLVFLPILSFSFKSHVDSVMGICTYAHERRSYLCHTKQLCNTCHASLTLSQFNTENAIR